MKHKTTLVLLAVALGLGAFIFLYERHTLSTSDVAERDQRLVPRLVRDRVREITIDKGDRRIALRRSEPDEIDDLAEEWALVEPIEGPADSEAIASMLGTVEWADPARTLSGIDQSDVERFGLDAPRMKVTLVVANETIELAFGGEDPTGAGVYARVDHQDEAHVVGVDVLEAFDHEVDHFRAKELFPGGIEQPRRIAIAHGEVALALEREDEAYVLVEGSPRMAALDTRIDALLASLRRLRAMRFVDGSGRDGLADPILTVEVEGEGEAHRTLRVGAPCDAEGEGRTLHARVDDGPVVCVEASSVEELELSPSDLRDLRPVPIRGADVRSLRLSRGNRTIEVARVGGAEADRDEPGGYRYTLEDGESSTEGPASRDALLEWVRAMRQAGAESFTPMDGDLARFGFDSPTATLSLGVEDDDRFELTIGATSPRGLYVRRGEEAVALLLPAGSEALFQPEAHRLRDLEVVDVDTSRVEEIVVEADGTVQRGRIVGGAWRLVEPVEVRADAIRMRDLARRLTSLTAERFVADRSDSSHGLDAARYTVRVELAPPDDAEGDPHDHEEGDEEGETSDGDTHLEELTLLVGADASGGAYARLEGDPAVFVVSAETLSLLEEPLADRGALSTGSTHLESLRFSGGEGGELRMKRSSGQWVDDEGTAIDDERARELVDRVARLRADAVLGFGSLHAGTIEGTVTVGRSEEGPEPREYVIQIGGTIDRRGTSYRRAARSDLGVIYLLDQETARGLLEPGS